MSLKRKISKATYDKLSDEMKALYTLKGDDYALDVETDSDEDDTGELRRANERLKQEAKDAKKRLKELEDAAADGDELDAKKKGDIEKLEKSWKEKNDKTTKEFTDKLTAKDAYIKKALLESAAKDVAAIATSPTLLRPHVMSRLDVDFDGEEPKIRVLDKDGKPSAATLDDLKKEFVANKEFSSIIAANKASGGAVKTQTQQLNGGAGTGADGKPLSYAAMKPEEIAAHRKAAKEAAAT